MNYTIHGEFVISFLVHINKNEFIILLSIRLKLHKFSFHFKIYRRKKKSIWTKNWLKKFFYLFFYFYFLFFFMIFMDEDKKKKEKKRTIWVRDIFKERNQKGTYNNFIQEMRLRDNKMFYR